MRPAFCASHIVHAAVNKKRASAVGKLGVYWHNPDGSVLKFHDDYW